MIALLFGFLVVIVAVLLAGLIYQSIGKWNDRRHYPAPGRLVFTNGTKFHVLEMGSGPTVVLEAGIASTSLAWVTIQKQLSAEAHVLTYDRAGLGWSSTAKRSRTLTNVVDELHAVLQASGVAPPYILVGHSYGGLIVRQFANSFPEEVSGLVLVDPVDTRDWSPLSAAQEKRLGRGVALSRRGAVLARFGVVRFALALLAGGNSHLPKLISRWSAGKGASATERLTGEVRKLPMEVWPMVQMHWSDEKCFRTMAEYLERLPGNAAEAAVNGWPQGMPITVLTVLTAVPDLPDGAVHRVAAKSGHWIQLDEPDLVMDAIRGLLMKTV